MIKCNGCEIDVTPGRTIKDIPHQIVKLNKEICLCHICCMVLGDFVGNEEFKKLVADFKKKGE